MIYTFDYELVKNQKTGEHLVYSNNRPRCPTCRETMVRNGTRRRKAKTAEEKLPPWRTYILSRWSCKNCGCGHDEFPSCILYQRYYETQVYENIFCHIDHSALLNLDDRTRNSILQWIPQLFQQYRQFFGEPFPLREMDDPYWLALLLNRICHPQGNV